MKVLHLCTKVPFPANDGGSLAVMAFARILKNAGHEVTILATNTLKHFQAEVPEYVEGISIKGVKVNTGINWAKFASNLIFGSLPYNVLRFKSLNFGFALKELLVNHPFDVIQLEGPHMGVYLPVIRRYSNAKVVLRAHNVEYLLWLGIKGETKSPVRRMYLKVLADRLKRFETALFCEVDGVLAITENDLQIIQKVANPKKCEVIPYLVDVAGNHERKEPQENTLFYIGALDWLPNQTGLLWFMDKVWPALRLKFPLLSFHIAGRNAPSHLKSRLIAENVYFYGEVPNAKVFMEEYQIQVVPLFSGSGVRVKILEGLACGKPIVTTSKGAEGIEVVDQKHLIYAHTPDEFIAQIGDLISNKLKRVSLEENARAFISKEFGNLALVNRIENFYRKLA